MDKRVDDMLKISDINNKILEFYHELAELEKEGQIDSPLYEGVCYAISYRKKEAKGLLYNYPLNDDYIDTYIDFSKKFDENRNPNNKTMELYDFKVIGLTTNRQHLYKIINNRVDKMINEGLLDEVKDLYKKYGDVRILHTAIGYKELIKYINNEISLDDAIELIKKNSRHYAKRQYTYFNHQLETEWFSVNYDNFDETIEKVFTYLNSK